MSIVDRTNPLPCVSVVVLSKDEPEVEDTLNALAPQIAEIGGECVVVDASAGRLEAIKLRHPWVVWIDYKGPLGVKVTIPHQRNAGVRAARAATIAFCDAGGIPADGWLEALVRPLLDKRTRATCGPIIPRRKSVYAVINDQKEWSVVESSPTANVAFEVSLFDEVGGFDEAFRYGSDLDFAWRILAKDAGYRCIEKAVMHIDWGTSRRQGKRALLYGDAQARLWLKHPERWKKLSQESPVLILYPLLLLALPVVVFMAARRRVWALGYVAVLLGLVFKNRKAPSPVMGVVQNGLFGAGALLHVVRRLCGASPAVLFMPRDPNPYQENLRSSLSHRGVETCYLEGPTHSASVNLLLLPVLSVRARIKGARIIHLHWTHQFSLSWARTKQARRLLRAWFSLWLWVCDKVGLKLVWSAHNLLPHSPIFDDDMAARRALVSSSECVIAFSTKAATELCSLFGVEAEVVDLGTVDLGSGDSSLGRSLLGGEGPNVLFFGRIEPYKGVERLFEVAPLLQDVAFKVAGECSDRTLREKLFKSAEQARAQGGNIVFEEGRLSDEDLAAMLAAADVVVLPFSKITNSSSVLSARSTGVPVVVPELEELSHVKDERVVFFNATRTLAQAIEEALKLGRDDGVVHGSWDEIAERHEAIYREALN